MNNFINNRKIMKIKNKIYHHHLLLNFLIKHLLRDLKKNSNKKKKNNNHNWHQNNLECKNIELYHVVFITHMLDVLMVKLVILFMILNIKYFIYIYIVYIYYNILISFKIREFQLQTWKNMWNLQIECLKNLSKIYWILCYLIKKLLVVK